MQGNDILQSPPFLHYDDTGNLRYKTQNGQTTEYQYDVLGRLTDIIYSDSAQNVTMTYDTGSGNNLLGRLATVTDPSGTVAYSYDGDGRLENESRTINGIAYVTGYGYDNAGNLRNMTYPTGQTVTYEPDTTDPALIGAVVLNGTVDLATGLSYKPFGPATGMTLGNSIVVSRTYDKNYQIGAISAGTVMQRTYTPDNVGNITDIHDNLDATRSQNFDYDDLYRLTDATGIYGTVSYNYDRVGNRTSRTQGATADTYTYQPGTNRLETVVGTHPELIQYDDDGNISKRIPGAANSQPAINDPSDYIYNSSGQRAKKKRAPPQRSTITTRAGSSSPKPKPTAQ